MKNRAPIHWTEEMLAALRMFKAMEVARKFGLNPKVVYKKRLREGLRIRKPLRWTKSKLAIIKRFGYRKAAKILKVSKGSVRKARRKFQIEPPGHPRIRRWSKRQLALLGTMSDGEVSRRTGIARVCIRVKRVALGLPVHRGRWTIVWLAALGKMPDTALGRLMGLKSNTVRSRRMKLGIPVFIDPRRIRWTNACLRMLGKATDRELGRRFYIRPIEIGNMRRKLGLPTYLQSKSPRCLHGKSSKKHTRSRRAKRARSGHFHKARTLKQ